CREAFCEWRLEQLGCDERAGAAAEARARVGGRADVPYALDGCLVRGAPEEVLVECEGAAVRVALHEVHVRRPQVGRREDCAREDRRLEIRDVLREALLDAVRIALPQVLAPGAVADVELAGGVALHVPGELLQL